MRISDWSSDVCSSDLVITGYHEYPHTDMAETAVRAGEILLAAIAGEKAPVITWGSVPMLPHTMNEGTFEAPNGTIQGKAARWEGEGRAPAASVFTGFNLADVPDAALGVVRSEERREGKECVR